MGPLAAIPALLRAGASFASRGLSSVGEAAKSLFGLKDSASTVVKTKKVVSGSLKALDNASLISRAKSLFTRNPKSKGFISLKQEDITPNLLSVKDTNKDQIKSSFVANQSQNRVRESPLEKSDSVASINNNLNAINSTLHREVAGKLGDVEKASLATNKSVDDLVKATNKQNELSFTERLNSLKQNSADSMQSIQSSVNQTQDFLSAPKRNLEGLLGGDVGTGAFMSALAPAINMASADRSGSVYKELKPFEEASFNKQDHNSKIAEVDNSSIVKGLTLNQEATKRRNDRFIGNDVAESDKKIFNLRGDATVPAIPRIQKFVDSLNKNASSRSTGYCARSIRRALVDGGYPDPAKGGDVGSAFKYSYGPLQSVGFNQIPLSSYIYPGDILVWPPSNNKKSQGGTHGHIEAWTGKNWVSDFNQKSAFPGISAEPNGKNSPISSYSGLIPTLWRDSELTTNIQEVTARSKAIVNQEDALSPNQDQDNNSPIEENNEDILVDQVMSEFVPSAQTVANVNIQHQNVAQPSSPKTTNAVTSSTKVVEREKHEKQVDREIAAKTASAINNLNAPSSNNVTNVVNNYNRTSGFDFSLELYNTDSY